MNSVFVQKVAALVNAEPGEAVAQLRTLLFDTFSNVDALSKCFDDSTNEEEAQPRFVNLEHLQTWYATVSDQTDTVFANAISTLVDHLSNEVQELKPGQSNVFLIVLENPVFLNVTSLVSIMPRLCHILANFSQVERIEFAWVIQESLFISSESKQARSHWFLQIISLIQQFITLRIATGAEADEEYNCSTDEAIVDSVQALSVFAAINEANEFVPFNEFYNEAIESSMDLKDEYPKWKAKEGFSFCNYPFILSTSAKGDILKIESMIQMRHELQDAFFRAMFIGVNSPYLQLEVRRNHVIRDALYQLEGKSAHDLKKQLRISFVGEEGIDEGGVQKEFFQLVVRDMFDPTYGMFRTNDLSRLCWFSNTDGVRDKGTLEEYTLMGRLIALAIYNGVVLNINFPLALYKKLLKCDVTLADLTEFDPDLGRGLTSLLEFDGDVEDIFCRSFMIEVDNPLGDKIPYDLIENGTNIPVTNSNRTEFVNLVVDFILNKNIEISFQAFLEGFESVMRDSTLKLFRPEELQELICGSPTLDFEALEKVTQYDGFEKDSKIIRDFWEVVHEFTEEQKKLLLFFTTGTDRVPVGGLSKLQFIIARNGTDSFRVPTSHTCYNVLLLCEYSSKEKLKERLLTALANSNCGFFLN